jgi:hypothetical protein
VQEPTQTGYAGLKALVEIANSLGFIDWNSEGYLKGLKKLAQALAHAQTLAGTPQALRVEAATLQTTGVNLPTVLVSRSSPLPAYRIRAVFFYADAQATLDILRRIARFMREKPAGPPSEWSMDTHPLVLQPQGRLLNITPDFAIDFGPEFFTDTLLRTLTGRDVRRIRQCPECPRLFVAVPEFKVTCSLRCSRLHRVHKFVADHPGYYVRSERKRRGEQRKGETVQQRKLAAARGNPSAAKQ